MVTIVFYSIGKVAQGVVNVTFWTKPDKSDLFKETFISLEDDRIRFRVQNKLKISNFKLEQV